MFIAHDIWPGNPAWVVIREIRAGEQSSEAQGRGRWRLPGKQMIELLELLVPGEGREGLERCASRSAVGECSSTYMRWERRRSFAAGEIFKLISSLSLMSDVKVPAQYKIALVNSCWHQQSAIYSSGAFSIYLTFSLYFVQLSVHVKLNSLSKAS